MKAPGQPLYSLVFLLLTGAMALNSSCSFRTEKQNPLEQSASELTTQYAWIQENILTPKCLGCHHPGDRRGGVDLSTYESVVSAQLITNGQPLVKPKQPESSRLFLVGKQGSMPPRGQGTLTPNEIEIIRIWIEKGAPLQSGRPDEPVPPSGPNLDEVKHFSWIMKNVIHVNQCLKCHSRPTARNGNVALNTYSEWMKTPQLVVPGFPKKSRIYQVLESGKMPPAGHPIPNELQKQALFAWIKDGAAESRWSPSQASTYQWIQSHILQPKCTGCHNATRSDAGVDLSSYEDTLEQVDLQFPEDSPLYDEVLIDNMPQSDDPAVIPVPLLEFEKRMILKWIKEGAQNN